MYRPLQVQNKFDESYFGLQTTVSAPSSYLSRALVEDYTGAWCGYCPRLSFKFDELTSNNPRIILSNLKSLKVI